MSLWLACGARAVLSCGAAAAAIAVALSVMVASPIPEHPCYPAQGASGSDGQPLQHTASAVANGV